MPGQMLASASPSPDDPQMSLEFVSDLKQKMSQSVQMPVLYHGHRHRQTHLPQDLLSAQRVLVRVDAVTPPLSRPYDGPYTVISKSPDAKTFTVDRGGRSWVVSVDRLKPAFSFSDSPNAPPIRSDDSAEEDLILHHSAPLPAPGLDPLPLAVDPVVPAPAPD